MKTLLFAFLFSLTISAHAGAVKGMDLLSGDTVEIKPGKEGAVVVFLSAKCPCSASHVEEIKSMAREFTAYQFIGVHSNSNEGKDLSRGYFKTVNLGFPILQDTDGSIAAEYRALKTPHAFLVSKDGKTLYKGGITDSKDCSESGRNFLREALQDVSQNKPVRTKEARTLGCAIARGGKSDW